MQLPCTYDKCLCAKNSGLPMVFHICGSAKKLNMSCWQSLKEASQTKLGTQIKLTYPISESCQNMKKAAVTATYPATILWI